VKASGQGDKNTETLQWICRSMLPAEFPAFGSMEIEASFYPYVGLTHTIRRNKSKWVIRISDHCRNAPRSVLEAIVAILACKVMHRRPRRRALQVYEAFCEDPRITEMVRERRLLRGRKNIGADVGKYHSPREIYRDVNGRYFNNQIEIRAIGWGPRKSWSRLGHYDPVHHTITLSPVLDSPRVPRFVLSYIIYHEMLHTVFEGTSSGGARKHHPPEFRRAERAYPDYENAKKFLREFCRKPAGNVV
jgi:hypothetical protein